MKKMAVFHAEDFPKNIMSDVGGMRNIDTKKVTFPRGYKLAATVDTNDIDHAFAQTNHVDTSWFLNEDVNATGLSLRSTSVGDVIVTAGGTYVVDTFGFALLREAA